MQFKAKYIAILAKIARFFLIRKLSEIVPKRNVIFN